MTSPRDDEMPTPATDEQITDLPAAEAAGDEVRGGDGTKVEHNPFVITKPIDVSSPILYQN